MNYNYRNYAAIYGRSHLLLMQQIRNREYNTEKHENNYSK